MGPLPVYFIMGGLIAGLVKSLVENIMMPIIGIMFGKPNFDEELVPITGLPPSLVRVPTGCAFHPRCRFARLGGRCDHELPELRTVTGDGHVTACHFAEELAEVSVESMRTARPS